MSKITGTVLAGMIAVLTFSIVLTAATATPAAAAVQCNGRYVSWVEYYRTSLGTRVSMQPTAFARAMGTNGNSGMWNDLWRCTPVPWRNFMVSWSSYQVDSAWDQMVCHNAWGWWFPGTYDYEQWRPRRPGGGTGDAMFWARCNP